MKTKICIKCGVRKVLTEFYKSLRNVDGYSNVCGGCNRAYRSKFSVATLKRRRGLYIRDKLKINRRNNKYYVKSRKKIIEHKRLRSAACPWLVHCKAAKERCNNPNHKSYKNYGGRGIRMLMTKEDFKKLWFRDRAYLLKQPSIDRIDNDGNYTLDNCRFIEHLENGRRRRIEICLIKPIDTSLFLVLKWMKG